MSDPSWSNQSLHKSQIDQTTILSTTFPIAFGHDTVGSEIQFVGKGNQWSSVTDRTNHTDKAVWSSPQASEADTLTPDFPRAMASMSTDNMKNHSRMPKFPKKPSQRVRFTCDADDMSMTKFDKQISDRSWITKAEVKGQESWHSRSGEQNRNARTDFSVFNSM